MVRVFSRAMGEDSTKGGEEGKASEVAGGEACCPVGAGAIGGVFPGVEEEAVQGADRSEEQSRKDESGAKVGAAGHGGDEDGSGKEDADGELFGQARRSGKTSVDEKKPGEQERAEESVEAKSFREQERKQHGQTDGAKDDDGKEGATMAMVEVVASFEVVGGVGTGGVEEAVAGVEHPDGKEHGHQGG